jgi:hypothetical protein
MRIETAAQAAQDANIFREIRGSLARIPAAPIVCLPVRRQGLGGHAGLLNVGGKGGATVDWMKCFDATNGTSIGSTLRRFSAMRSPLPHEHD